ncbi:MAG TPA: hypothetical protein ENI15_06290, partial [Spirochaetes bacterium]|nr:hypothetical protein [Spirochaetota bacterium]
DPKYDIELGKKRVYRPISGSINIHEYENVKDYKKDITTRKANSRDVKNIAKIVQNLSFIHYNATAVLPNDVPEKAMDITAAKICFENCSKHILVDTLNIRSFEAVLEMAFKIAGSEEEFKKRPFSRCISPRRALSYSTKTRATTRKWRPGTIFRSGSHPLADVRFKRADKACREPGGHAHRDHRRDNNNTDAE